MGKFFSLSIGILLSLSAKSQMWDSLQEGIPSGVGPRIMYADTFDNYLYAGGSFFYQSNGKQYNMIARWNGLQWDTMGTGTYGGGNVLAMARYNGELYVGGGFDSAGSKSARNIAKWNGTKWDTLPVQPFKISISNGIVNMAVINNELYIGGTFDSVAGLHVNGIAKWNGSNWSGINFPNLQSFSMIGSIIQYNGEIYVAGNFNSGAFPNDTIGEIARYDGVNWKSVGGGINGSISGVESMTVYNGELYVAGYFRVQDGNVGNYIQKWNGTAWSDVGGGMAGLNNNPANNGQIHKLLVHQNKLYALGVFSYAGGVPAQYIAIWNGLQWCGLGSSFDNVAWPGTFYNDTLYIGGGFWTVDGDSVNHIAKWTGGTYVDTCGNTSGITETNFSNEINIYPNPSDGIFTIQSTEKISEIEITNILGEKIYFEKINSEKATLNLISEPKGIYFVKVISKENLFTEKIIIQ